MPMGANFGDIDNDGFLDIYLGHGQPVVRGAAGRSVLLQQRRRQAVRRRHRLVRHGRTAQGPRHRLRRSRQRRRRGHRLRGRRRDARRRARAAAVRESRARQRLDRVEARRRRRRTARPSARGSPSPLTTRGEAAAPSTATVGSGGSFGASAARAAHRPRAGRQASWTWRSGGRPATRGSTSSMSARTAGGESTNSVTG